MSWRWFVTAWFGVCSLTACPQGSDDPLDGPSSATAAEGSSSMTGETAGESDSDEPSTTTTGTTGDDSVTTTDPGTTSSSTTATSSTDDSTTTGGPAAICGNGVVEDGEACDEGDANADDGTCTLSCALPKCGDGLVQPGNGEECDDGPENSNENHCTKDCVIATCGDGLIEVGVEACDDGDDNNGSKYNGCIPELCQLGPHCGDGVLQDAVEECDNGGENGPEAACSESCTWGGKLVFVTSAFYKGNLGGIGGADMKCKALAAAAGLANAPAFLAWLSAGLTSPAVRMTPSDKPYRLRTGDVIADNWQDLVDGALDAKVNVTEKGTLVEELVPAVWSNTIPSGALKDNESACNSWTSDVADHSGNSGVATSASTEWTDNGALPCSVNARLYCVEQ